MTFYMQKEPHQMLSGHMTVKFRWWTKDDNGNITRYPAQIQHQTQLKEAIEIFKEDYPNGKILKKDLT